MARLFGTDGVRGVAVTELTCEIAHNIGKAAAHILSETHSGGGRPVVIVGKDTRRSSDILEAALVAGVTAAGGDVQLVGVVPTPAVAYLVRRFGADAGVMITASHNTAEFNGIKLFNKDGLKFPDEKEDEIQAIVENPDAMRDCLKNGAQVGTITERADEADDYTSYLNNLIEKIPDRFKILVDCANGSASFAAKKVFHGTDFTFIHNSPDGININDGCGSTHIDALAKQVVADKYDLGIAFDGDADRMLAVDSVGNVVDGDKIIALLSVYMREKGELNNDTAVVTVMSNLGFHKFMKANNIKTEVVTVGDRYVLERMLRDDYSIGGEQSGHIIFKKHATTGDGLLTAVKVLNLLGEKGVSLHDLASDIPELPQTLKNVVISNEGKGKWESNPAITKVIEEVKSQAGENFRLLVRESGTEPLLRVMIEGENQAQIEEWAALICDAAKKELS
ncbi:MAG: phosphoglucosamine mutase [Oscillospiraceae bacterium]|nr:phosphoglucosamine mutase [Oscillospiraceae bacterium]